MRSILFVSAISLGSGCAAHVAQPATTPTTPVASDTRSADEQETARVRELRAQLALANARNAEQARRSAAHDTVTIGGDAPEDDAEAFFSGDDDWDDPAERLPPLQASQASQGPDVPEDRNRPVLRLYGVPEAPPISAEGLPPLPYATGPFRQVTTTPPVPPTSVVPSNDHLPWESAPAGDSSPAHVGAPQRVDLGLESYRSALGMLRARRFAESLVAFERFEQAHPNHPQVSSARYWRAELYYIQRQYGQARTAFQTYIGLYPRGSRVADALLKLSLCSRRLGNEQEATAHMDRLRRDFPSSEAARLASREVNR